MPSATPAAARPPTIIYFMVCAPSRDGLLVNRHDGLVGVVFLVCLARVVFAGGVDRPRDVSATRAFAGDDENVVHLTVLSALVGLWAEPRDRVDDDGVRGSGVQLGVHHRCAIWSLLHPTWGSVTRVLPPGVVRCESNH